jgi:hypothetical protein
MNRENNKENQFLQNKLAATIDIPFIKNELAISAVY